MSPTSADLHEQLVTNLSFALSLIALSRRKYYEQLQHDPLNWIDPRLFHIPGTAEAYAVQVQHGAFLMAYAHFEAHLQDLARMQYEKYPRKLSSKRELKVKDILDTLESSTPVLEMLIQRELRSLFAQSLESVLDHFEERFQAPVPQTLKRHAIEASLVRNALLHNGAVAHEPIPSLQLAKGQPIRLGIKQACNFIVTMLDTCSYFTKL